MTSDKELLQRRRNHKAWAARNPEKMRAYKRAWKKRNPEKVREDNRARKRPPEQKAAADKRYRAKHSEQLKAKKRAEYQANKEKRDEQNKAWAAAHPERHREIKRNWSKNHPEYWRVQNGRRRAYKLAAPRNDLTPAQWREIKDAYGHQCVYCGRKMERLTQDHIIPLSKGGSHTVSNVVPACLACNRKKSAGPPPVPVQPLLFTTS